MGAPSLAVRPVRDRRPLSVQVYDRIVVALRESDVQPGHPIPPEVRLAAELGVSRTVLREALRLLEEDGVLERGADRRRRHLAAAPASRAPGFHGPLEEVLGASGPIRVDVVRHEKLPATSWSARLLDVAADAELACRESLLTAAGADGAAGEPVASALELVPSTEPALAAVGPDPHQTLLQALGAQFRSRLVPSLWRLAPGSARATRVGLDALPRGAVLGSLTIVLARHGRPVYLAKHVLRLDAVVLAVGAVPGEMDAAVDDAELAAPRA